jgi:hypothetical protein
VIGKLAGLAIDARFATGRARPGGRDPAACAIAARWIAANALAARGVQVALDGIPPGDPVVFALRADSLAAVIAAVAAVPLLVDTTALPRRWRLGLCALGLPTLAGSIAAALAGGASVLSPVGVGQRELAVALDADRYRVRIAPPAHQLVA